jgi:murein DD-endopeptidase MepM/ murein hydrolase activator NlpD
LTTGTFRPQGPGNRWPFGLWLAAVLAVILPAGPAGAGIRAQGASSPTSAPLVEGTVPTPPPVLPPAPKIDPGPFPTPLCPVVPLQLRLPTDNRALLEGRPEDFFMGVDRTVEGKAELVWQGGQFGFVRNPAKLGDETYFIRFHEGLDIKPTLRDNRGEPLDLVRAIADGRIVFVNATPGASNYGKYVVVEHNWGYGTFYSLYAHLMRVEAEAGAPVRAGQTLGRLGYTGSGIDRRRAHLHLELNMLLSDTFEQWQRQMEAASLTASSVYHGHNLAGLDIAELFKAQAADPGLTIPGFLATQEPYYKVLAPAGPQTPSLLRRYPWLNPLATTPAAPPVCPSYEITLTASGLPLSMVPSALTTPYPVVVASVPFHGRHSWRTSGRLGGTGTAAELTAKGAQYIKLLTGAL